MDKQFTVDSLLSTWNETFPNYQLTPEDLKKPHALMGALLQVFELLGIDVDTISSPPPELERNESLRLFWDLIPVINVTRVANSLIVLPQFSLSNTITVLLQPNVNTSFSQLLIFYNYIIYRAERIAYIAPLEEQVYSKTDKVQELTDKMNELMVLVNKQHEEKAERGMRLRKIDNETTQYDEELKPDKEALDEIKKVLEAVQKECRQKEITFGEKKGHRDALEAEVTEKRALRVYDGDDIKTQVELSAKNLRDVEEKLTALHAKLTQKDDHVKNLQSNKSYLDIANNLIYEIKNLSDSLRDCEKEDAEVNEKEQVGLDAELRELEAQAAELRAARAEASEKRQEAMLKRQQERAKAQSNLREAEEVCKKSCEQSKAAAQNLMELKESTPQYVKSAADYVKETNDVKENLIIEFTLIREAVIKAARLCQVRCMENMKT